MVQQLGPTSYVEHNMSVEDKLKLLIGEQAVSIIILNSQLEEANKKIAELEKTLESSDG